MRAYSWENSLKLALGEQDESMDDIIGMSPLIEGYPEHLKISSHSLWYFPSEVVAYTDKYIYHGVENERTMNIYYDVYVIPRHPIYANPKEEKKTKLNRKVDLI